jgi:Domain of unknown function (DUF4333)
MRRALLLAVPALAVLVACGGAPTTGDFRDEAETFINGTLNEEPQLNGLTFSDAECQEPESTETGTAFTCSASASDGEPRTLSVTITGRNRFQVQDIQPPLPAGPTASAPAAGAPATSAVPTTPAPTTTAPG